VALVRETVERKQSLVVVCALLLHTNNGTATHVAPCSGLRERVGVVAAVADQPFVAVDGHERRVAARRARDAHCPPLVVLFVEDVCPFGL
jgi:hypothetical protein